MDRQISTSSSLQNLDARGRGTVWSILLVRRQLRCMAIGQCLEVQYDDADLPRDLAKILDGTCFELSTRQVEQGRGVLRIRRLTGRA